MNQKEYDNEYQDKGEIRNKYAVPAPCISDKLNSRVQELKRGYDTDYECQKCNNFEQKAFPETHITA